MRDALPSIHISVSDPLRFLDKMALLAEKLESFVVRRQVRDPVSKDLTVASFSPSRRAD
jgi:hypothetical protein